MSDYAWSKSSLKSLLDGCSWQWALRKIYEIEDYGSPQTSMGTGVHKALEEWEKSERSLALKELQTIAAESAFEQCKELPMEQWFEHSTDPEQVIELAKESVRVWWETPINKGAPIKQIVEGYKWLGSELYWNQKFGDFNIHGFVDSVYDDGRDIIIVDNKTASSMRRWKYEQDMNVEAALYMALAHKAQNEGLLPDKQITFEYHVMSAKEGKARIINMGYMGQDAFDILHEALTEATAIKKHSAYRPNPEWNLCSRKYCAYFEGCRINGTLSPYNLTISNVPKPDTSTSTPLEVPAEG
jgi:hypothetical protein